jgi:23S rRNA pseudouridine1911/1915/1917 synthase
MKRTRVKQLLQHGRVSVNGDRVTRHDHLVKPGDVVAIARLGDLPMMPRLTTVYEDDVLLAIDKPSGLLTVATEREKQDTAFARLSAELHARNAGRPYVVHRLDRGTSGLLLFARTPAVRDRLQASWGAAEKTYLAIVEGTPRPAAGAIENDLLEGKSLRVRVVRPGGAARHAVSRYRVLAAHGEYSLVEVKLETGRKHQIRVHLSHLGCPVAGDSDYGAKTDPIRRLALHAWKLACDHPVSGVRMELEATAPEFLLRLGFQL